MMIKAGDRIEWDPEAHDHTRYFSSKGMGNTGRIYGILPKGFAHISERVAQCRREDASILWVEVDNDTARLGFCADCKDLQFPDGEEDDGMSLLDDLWDEQTTELVNDLMT